jgi:hypothetical protein
MTDAPIAQQLGRYLDELPLEMQRKVLEFTRALTRSQANRTPGAQLLDLAGTIDRDDALAMSQAIQAHCD